MVGAWSRWRRVLHGHVAGEVQGGVPRGALRSVKAKATRGPYG